MRKSNLIRSKKGDLHIGFVAMYLIPFMFILLIMGFVLYAITAKYSSAFLAKDPDLLNNIYAYRSINVCFAYQDSITQRYYPGIIDFEKYNEKNFEKCYSDTTKLSFNMKLRDVDQDINYDTIRAGFGASLRQLEYPVSIKYKDGSLKKGVLYFGVSE